MSQEPFNKKNKEKFSWFNRRKKNNPDPSPGKRPRFNNYWTYGIVSALLIGFSVVFFKAGDLKEIDQSSFLELLQKGDVARYTIINNRDKVNVFLKVAVLKNYHLEPTNKQSINNPHFYFRIVSGDSFKEDMRKFYTDHPALKDIGKVSTESDWLSKLLPFLGPLLLLTSLLMLIRKVKIGTDGIFSIGKSKAALFDKDAKVAITFADVAGLDEAKVEVMEIVDFLKNQDKFTALGGKIPKGALLIGPPGTGKTLLAKAVAGEAEVPFFSLSGSDFIEVYAGVGASRVRDLFEKAREKSPCIIFIDEIDAIGRARRNDALNDNDERESTLNQLLVEMDGFATNAGIIVIAATNRPDVLDSALLRPGRFDRHISIDTPDLCGREIIFNVHLRPLKVSQTLDVHKLAAQTPGFAGAEIANVCNEAALIAARKEKDSVDMEDFHDAIDRIIGGLEKKNKIISPDEKRIIAYHEAGHAICGWYLEHAHPLLKVTIVPRGTATLGYAQYTPKEQYLYNTRQLFDHICMILGGRVSEEIFFNDISTGAENDLQEIRRIAYDMVSVYGMNEKIGHINFNEAETEKLYTRPYSEQTSNLIDEEVRNLISNAYQVAKQLLLERRSQVELLAEALLEKEVLFRSDVEILIGKHPFANAEELQEVA